jgi:hypothetical protein
MSIATIASKKACTGSGSGVNTGKLGCLSLFGTPAHLLLFPAGYIIPAETIVNDAWLRPLIQKGTVVPLIDASAFEDVSGTDNYSTNTKGRKRLNLKGLPEYRFAFEEGHEFYRELAKLESYKSKDAWIGDTDGNWMVVKRSDGDFGAFTGGHLTPELTKRQVEGGDSEMKHVLMQFLNRIEWDRQYEILHAEELPFTPQEVPQINGIVLIPEAIPADTDTTITFDVVLASDNDTVVEGLETADFVLKVDGATIAMAVVENTPGNYTGTFAAVASGDAIEIDTFHGATNSNVADSNSVLYRAVETIAEVIA